MRPLRCGIWIDNAEAIVVRFEPDREPVVHRIESGVSPHSKTRGGMSGTRGQIGGASHKKAERRRLGQLSKFFEEVWADIEDADEIAIMGPGTAKKGLESQILKHDQHPEVVAVEPADRRTDPQLVADFRKILKVPGKA